MERGYERKRNRTYGGVGVGGLLYVGRQHPSFSISTPSFLADHPAEKPVMT